MKLGSQSRFTDQQLAKLHHKTQLSYPKTQLTHQIMACKRQVKSRSNFRTPLQVPCTVPHVSAQYRRHREPSSHLHGLSQLQSPMSESFPKKIGKILSVLAHNTQHITEEKFGKNVRRDGWKKQ